MKKVIVVGAGIAGLSAAIYARQSGFDVTIYESHTIPGGASTGWRRGGYFFEGGMHWLTGSSPATALHRLWREVGALDDSVKVTCHDPFFVCEDKGRQLCLYRDSGRLREHLLALSPGDSREIRRLCADIKKFTRLSMPISDVKGVRLAVKHQEKAPGLVAMLPALLSMGTYGRITVNEYLKRFQSPQVRRLLSGVVPGEYAATAMLFTLATFAAGDGGYPEGGSLAMTARMARYFQSLGGTIHYKSPVSRVETAQGQVRGVWVEDRQIKADAVIVTQDARTAVDRLFTPALREGCMEKMRRDTRPILNTFICLGVEADLSDVPERVEYVLKEPFSCAGVEQHALGMNNYAGYPRYAPEGCTALTSILMGDSYDFWKTCREAGTYQEEKEKLAGDVMNRLAQCLPQTKGKVRVWDVATPLTYERYLGSYKGSWMTLMPPGQPPARYPCKSGQVQGLYFAGQRLMAPGGLPVALETGRRAVQQLCLQEDITFRGGI
jgi:phytoene dehydrogenase-like protein